jgi:hypothetical protein
MKRELFFLVLLVIGIILWVESKQYWQTPKIEGFKADPSPTLNVPAVKPKPVSLAEGEPQPFAPPSAALYAPPPVRQPL